jgi:hypothetical protein
MLKNAPFGREKRPGAEATSVPPLRNVKASQIINERALMLQDG